MRASRVVRWACSAPRTLGVTALLGTLAVGPAAAQTASRPGLSLDAGITYGRLVQSLKKADIQIDRKILADLAVRDAATFGRIVEVAKSA